MDLLFPVINESAENVDFSIVKHTAVNNASGKLVNDRISHFNRNVNL